MWQCWRSLLLVKDMMRQCIPFLSPELELPEWYKAHRNSDSPCCCCNMLQSIVVLQQGVSEPSVSTGFTSLCVSEPCIDWVYTTYHMNH